MAEHKLGHGDCPACQEDTNRSMLELVALRTQLKEAQEERDAAVKLGVQAFRKGRWLWREIAIADKDAAIEEARAEAAERDVEKLRALAKSADRLLVMTGLIPAEAQEEGD